MAYIPCTIEESKARFANLKNVMQDKMVKDKAVREAIQDWPQKIMVPTVVGPIEVRFRYRDISDPSTLEFQEPLPEAVAYEYNIKMITQAMLIRKTEAELKKQPKRRKKK